MFLDARIPVFLAETADMSAEGVHWLIEDPSAPWGEAGLVHPVGCVCCVTPSPVATLLRRLFRARAVGALPLFSRLGAIPAGALGRTAVIAAVETDAYLSACFRIDAGGSGHPA